MFTDRSKRCKTSKRKLLNYRQHYGPEIVMWPPLAERSTVTASDCPKRWIQMPPVSSDPLAVCGVGAPSYHLSLLIVRLILFFYVLRPKYLSPCDLHLNSLPQKIPPLSGLPLFFFFFSPNYTWFSSHGSLYKALFSNLPRLRPTSSIALVNHCLPVFIPGPHRKWDRLMDLASTRHLRGFHAHMLNE